MSYFERFEILKQEFNQKKSVRVKRYKKRKNAALDGISKIKRLSAGFYLLVEQNYNPLFIKYSSAKKMLLGKWKYEMERKKVKLLGFWPALSCTIQQNQDCNDFYITEVLNDPIERFELADSAAQFITNYTGKDTHLSCWYKKKGVRGFREVKYSVKVGVKQSEKRRKTKARILFKKLPIFCIEIMQKQYYTYDKEALLEDTQTVRKKRTVQKAKKVKNHKVAYANSLKKKYVETRDPEYALMYMKVMKDKSWWRIKGVFKGNEKRTFSLSAIRYKLQDIEFIAKNIALHTIEEFNRLMTDRQQYSSGWLNIE